MTDHETGPVAAPARPETETASAPVLGMPDIPPYWSVLMGQLQFKTDGDFQLGIDGGFTVNGKRYFATQLLVIHEVRKYRGQIGAAQKALEAEEIAVGEYNDRIEDIYCELITGPLTRANPDAGLQTEFIKASFPPLAVRWLASFFWMRSTGSPLVS